MAVQPACSQSAGPRQIGCRMLLRPDGREMECVPLGTSYDFEYQMKGMDMGFERLSIKAKLIFGFMLLSAMLGFVGARGIFSAQHLNEKIKDVGEGDFKNIQVVQAVKEI